MFARFAGRATHAVQVAQHAPLDIQVRNAATLKSLQIRMKSIKNMQKITKAMKMVAAAKMKKDLCGGVNSAVNKQIRLGVNDEESKGNVAKVIVLGQKGVAGMKRLYGDRFTCSFEEVSKMPFTFATASIMAERIVKQNPHRLKVTSNVFKNMVTYHTGSRHTITINEAQTMDKSEFSKTMDVYSFEPSIYEVWNDLHEFYYGAVIYSAFINSAVTETAQRMSAMENASKNAGEMYEKVSLQFNRARQAKITTELCEIISGASAV